jgi:excisionase family DNA binding protein
MPEMRVERVNASLNTKEERMSDWLTVSQVAEMLDVDEKTVTRWSRADPTMPVLRRGRVVRFRRDLLDCWLEAQLPRKARQRTASAPSEQLSKST